MDWIMTGGDDILYLITLRNLEIHLVIGFSQEAISENVTLAYILC